MQNSERSYRVLVVDDDREMLRDITECLTLSKDRIVVEGAGSSADGLERLRRSSYHLMFIDRWMSNLRGEHDQNAGEELFRLVNRDYPYTDCVILTNTPLVKEIGELQKLGLAGYLVKDEDGPPDIRALTESILRKRLASVRKKSGRVVEIDPLDFYGEEGVVARTVGADDPGIVSFESGSWEAELSPRFGVHSLTAGTRVRVVGARAGRGTLDVAMI